MSLHEPIPVVDLFAGPGGLGEGFSSFDNGKAFKILISAEMDEAAHKTLRLRAFYRILQRTGKRSLDSYYRFCNGEAELPWNEETKWAWDEAENEARRIELGTKSGNGELYSILDEAGLNADKPWVLIGGPPCQAYSLVGRARNKGKVGYRAEDDHRHYLYREYLNIIERYHPAVFVMENVKGILSSHVGEKRIFHTILRDLSDPAAAVGRSKNGYGYKLFSIAAKTSFERGMNPDEINANDYIIRSEEYGIPQARHRVILLGVRDDITASPTLLRKAHTRTTVEEAIGDLPKLRSKLSKEADSQEAWAFAGREQSKSLLRDVKKKKELTKLAGILADITNNFKSDLSFGGLRVHKTGQASVPQSTLDRWYRCNRLHVWLNHESRGHMVSDLYRYLYASAFAKAYDRSPKGHEEFDLPGLKPEHKNWESGKFADRFRVQIAGLPATTVTSHISKDGHYFIHYDPLQCRSLTVREAARLQTFPDNYFFQGNRTQQFHQVGNAVPPLLALKIADLVSTLMPPSR